MSTQIVCDEDASGYEVVRKLNKPTRCAKCGKVAQKVIDTQRRTKSQAIVKKTSALLEQELQQENKAAFLAGLETKEISRSMELKLPRDWVIVNYGIPKLDGLRYRLSLDLRFKFGLISRDIGGSFYVGPGSPELDQALSEYVKKLRAQLGGGSWINLIKDTFNEENSTVFHDAAIEGALAEMNHVETSIEQLERCLVGDDQVLDSEGKPRNPLTFGTSRIRSANKALDSMDLALQRFQGNEALERAADRIKLRVKEVAAYVRTVENSLNARIVKARTMGSEGLS